MFNEKFNAIHKSLNTNVPFTLDGISLLMEGEPNFRAPISHTIHVERFGFGNDTGYDLFFNNELKRENCYSITLTHQRAKELADFFTTIAKFYKQEM